MTFVSPESQFTPKQVETADERDKLMFRVKVQLPPDRVKPYLYRIQCHSESGATICGLPLGEASQNCCETFPLRLCSTSAFPHTANRLASASLQESELWHASSAVSYSSNC